MSKLWTIFACAMLLSIFFEYGSSYIYGKLGIKQYIKKDKIASIFLILVVAVFAGLRISYNDTWTYRINYEVLTGTDFLAIDMALGKNPGFNFISTLFRVLGVSTQSYIMFFTLLIISIYVWFIRKYTNSFWMSVFFFFTMGCYTFTMSAIKQCVAVAFCLIGVDCAIQKKWGLFIFWVLLAVTFHPYALMYLAVPFLMFNPWTNKTYVMMAIFGVLGVTLQGLLGTIVDVTSMMGESYDATTFSKEGINIFRLLVVWIPVLLSFLARKFLKSNNDRATNLIVNLSTLNAEIMFVGLFGTANYFGRLANYFLIFQTMSLPFLFNFFQQQSRKLLIVGAIAGFLLYFYYANGIMEPFNSVFSQTSLFNYLKTLF